MFLTAALPSSDLFCVFPAISMQDKRLKQKKETDERRVRREEEKAMRRALLQQQEDSKIAKRLEITKATSVAHEKR